MALEAGRHLAKEYNTVVSISGETDIITDGNKVLYVSGGSPLMPLNTGMGCTSTAITGAMIAAAAPLIAAASAMCIMASAGKRLIKNQMLLLVLQLLSLMSFINWILMMPL